MIILDYTLRSDSPHLTNFWRADWTENKKMNSVNASVVWFELVSVNIFFIIMIYIFFFHFQNHKKQQQQHNNNENNDNDLRIYCWNIYALEEFFWIDQNVFNCMHVRSTLGCCVHISTSSFFSNLKRFGTVCVCICVFFIFCGLCLESLRFEFIFITISL